MEIQEKKMYREIQMSALSLQIPAVRLVAGGARQRQQQRGRHQHQQPALHRQGPGGDQGGCYIATSGLTILGTPIKHVCRLVDIQLFNI